MEIGGRGVKAAVGVVVGVEAAVGLMVKGVYRVSVDGSGLGRRGTNVHDVGVSREGGVGVWGGQHEHRGSDEGGSGRGGGGGSGRVSRVQCTAGDIHEVAVG